ncbi:MAG TPA: prepilin-type N-terminal cleavage/methylation domain-containing protein [Actinobacteria bacterium]|nr:prepilin-type N-terminal cleavage/methylation domain-containing protein [Actinomycetota bacterium]
MKLRQNRYFKKFLSQKGFSLIELLIVIFIIMIIASIASVLYLNTVRSQEDILGRAKSQKDARTVLYIMEKEIRECVSVINAENNDIRFLSNIDRDDEFEEISYHTEISGNNYILFREEDGTGARIFLDSLVNDDIFSYYHQADSDPLDLPLDEDSLNVFKILKIEFLLNDEPELAGKNIYMSSSVYLRNR